MGFPLSSTLRSLLVPVLLFTWSLALFYFPVRHKTFLQVRLFQCYGLCKIKKSHRFFAPL